MDELEPRLLLGNQFLWTAAALIDCKNSKLTIGAYNDLVANVVILQKLPKINRTILAARKTVIPPRSRAFIPINCKDVPENRTYFFQGYFTRAQDAILDHANFVCVVNDTDIAKTVFPHTKLSNLSNTEYEAFYAGHKAEEGQE